MLFWLFAALVAICGVLVYIELGLTIPRWSFGSHREKISTPRSGEALNYVRTASTATPFLRGKLTPAS